jgi:hypothetical protein
MKCDNLKKCIENEYETEKEEMLCEGKTCIISSDVRSKVKCSEKGKSYVLDNKQNNHIVVYRVDGGVISQGLKKCDYMFVSEKELAILIELKGCNVSDAFKQIDSTLNEYNDLFVNMKGVFGRIIAISSIPDIRNKPEYVKLSKKLIKLHGNLKIGEIKMVEEDKDISPLS